MLKHQLTVTVPTWLAVLIGAGFSVLACAAALVAFGSHGRADSKPRDPYHWSSYSIHRGYGENSSSWTGPVRVNLLTDKTEILEATGWREAKPAEKK